LGAGATSSAVNPNTAASLVGLWPGDQLLATGEKVRSRAAETRDDLTEQEQQIGRLAREGLSNQEIGPRLFLSARTVEWHLRKVYMKLGIHSRGELAGALPSSDSQPVTA
jgi:DNA-binding NarL/FixJ family response regulator